MKRTWYSTNQIIASLSSKQWTAKDLAGSTSLGVWLMGPALANTPGLHCGSPHTRWP